MRSTRLRFAASVVGLGLALVGCGGVDEQAAAGEELAASEPAGEMILASTTSTRDSGLLDELIPAFEQETGIEVDVIAVGSGEAIQMGSRGEADAVLAHSPAAEQELMESGVAGDRRPVMHNDFVIVGPEDDPAGIEDDDDAVEAMERIAEQEATFVSRGDESGTNAKELSLWEEAGIEPSGSWYVETGQGMGATLAVAAEQQAYTLADRGTYLSNEQASDLPIQVDGGEGLLNLYHVIDIDSEAGERVNAEAGDAFAEWLVSDEAQQVIDDFGEEEYGQALFDPDAGQTVEEVEAGN